MKPTVICFGEALADNLPSGPVLGGAPFNVARHLSQLDCAAHLMSAWADDATGRLIKAEAVRFGVNIVVSSSNSATPSGQVQVLQDPHHGHQFVIEPHSAWDHIPSAPAALDLLSNHGTLVYGTLALRQANNRQVLSELKGAAQGLVVCDFNWRQGHTPLDLAIDAVHGTHWLKLNDDELELLTQTLQLSSPEALMNHFQLETLIVTRGAEGYSAYLSHADSIHGLSPPVAHLQDTVGAGDAFLACTLAAYLHQVPLSIALELGAAFAGTVCGLSGAVPADLAFYHQAYTQLLNHPLSNRLV